MPIIFLRPLKKSALSKLGADIPWREIGGFRNILVHSYLGDIDPLTIVAVIDQQLEPLKRCIETMLEEKPS